MNKKEFTEILEIVQDKRIDLTDVDETILHGCALPDYQFPVFVTRKQVAKLIRWDCLQFNGEFDAEELNNIGIIGKRKFRIVG